MGAARVGASPASPSDPNATAPRSPGSFLEAGDDGDFARPARGSLAQRLGGLAGDPTGRAPETAWERRLGSTGVRTAGSLLTALARTADPEELVRLILERSDTVARGMRALSGEASSLVDGIVRGSAPEPEVRTITQLRTITRRVTRAGPSLQPLRPQAEATHREGVGASGVTKLAGKLLKLIHLAEAERRKADAQRQVRMAEDSSEARADGIGQTGGERVNDKTMNLKALQQDVLDYVMRELESLRSRREESDGPNNWC
ncbi:MAG: hypothetical protein ABMA64_33755 [Myxococcota bacterium]